MSDQRPFSIIREGAIAVSPWERSGKRGSDLEFTLSRSYKAGEVFRYTTTFQERDAEVLKRVIGRAAEGIREKIAMDRLKTFRKSSRAEMITPVNWQSGVKNKVTRSLAGTVNATAANSKSKT